MSSNVVVNLRGTHGSGKTTVVRKILNKYPCYSISLPNKKKVEGYRVEAPYGTLHVVGSYETTCGGCDTIQPYEEIWDRIVKYSKLGHVLYEGALVSNVYGRLGERSAKEFPREDYVFAFLNTPLETCIERVVSRRKEKGNTKPFDPDKSLVRVYKSNARTLERIQNELDRAYRIIEYRLAVGQTERIFKDAIT